MQLTIDNAEQMRRLGELLVHALPPLLTKPLFIALHGDLGAGKTTLVSGVLRALGRASHARSPTYTLLEPYESEQLNVYHLDLYRLSAASDLEMLGVRELMNPQALFFVEWPERGAGWLPQPSVEIHIGYSGQDGRSIRLLAHDVAGRQLLDAVTSQVNLLSS